MSKYTFFKEALNIIGIGAATLGSTVAGSIYLAKDIEKNERRRIEKFENDHPGEDWVRRPRRCSPHRFAILQYDIVPAKKSDVCEQKPQSRPDNK